MKIIGKLNQRLDVQSGETERGMWFRGGMVLVSLDGQQRPMAFVVNGRDSTDRLAQIPIGSTIQCDYSIESREFNGKWYTDLRAYNIEVLTSSKPTA